LTSCNHDNAINQAEIKADTQNLEIQSTRKCASHEYNSALMNEHPEFAIKHREIEDFTRKFVLEYDKSAYPRKVMTIPVVVHIVYKTPQQKIGAAQIQSQIDVLNEDFRKRNADLSIAPTVFKNIAADCGIQFKLTKTIYTQTNREVFTAYSQNESVKQLSPVLSPETTLNIWVCNLGQGVLGYAQFPGGPAETDGIVVHYLAFGRIGTLYTAFNKGRTATHEVGHWLNLYHIWGDDGGGCAADDATPNTHPGTDEVADTPDQAGPNIGCPVFPKISCNNGPNGDMFYSYMDYSDDACLVMFSKGQGVRMQAAYVSRFGF
jgi:hypothetical protein